MTRTRDLSARPVAAGLLLFRGLPWREFLLMRHHDRWDLPKGHLESGETVLEAALRETEEETGIPREQLVVDREFRYEVYYPVRSRTTGEWVEKQLVIFLAEVPDSASVTVTEHIGYRWFSWPVHDSIQLQTIDRLIDAVAARWSRKTARPSGAARSS